MITSWNRAAERVFGYSAEEAIGQNILLIIPADRRSEEEGVLSKLRRGEKIDHFETVRRTKDGRQIPISLTVSPVRDASGTLIGASKVARDISERVLAQDALRRTREQLEERVRERTAELSAANVALHRAVEHKQRVEEQRAQLFTRLVLAQEDERRRIAVDLHDQLGQQMTACVSRSKHSRHWRPIAASSGRTSTCWRISPARSTRISRSACGSWRPPHSRAPVSWRH